MAYFKVLEIDLSHHVIICYSMPNGMQFNYIPLLTELILTDCDASSKTLDERVINPSCPKSHPCLISWSLAILCSPSCLLVSNTTDILAVDYKTLAVNSVVSGLTRAVAIDVHFSLGYIFWSDVTERNIKRFRIDESNTTTIITGIGACEGLAVDWRASQLYWTDTTYETISVSDLDGNNQSLLISSDLDKPRAIALDLDSRYLQSR